ncbi:hypothetical protein ACFVVA_37055 [Kitasatospora sp. NPDC058048]|uniref:hypothetical protein n=1 Tax=Kitasatospora sp. NPDC058048 TaxID=3346313 RepID=UPI0036DC3070
MIATDYLEAVRAELGNIRPDGGSQSDAACAWRWTPGHDVVNREVWEGDGVAVTWTAVSGWWVAGLRDDSVTDRSRLELATWAEPDWVAGAVWDALVGDACADNRPRRIWEGVPGLRAPVELLYAGGPFDGRAMTWQRSESAAVSLPAGSYDGTWWPYGCYVLDHGDRADRPRSRFLWLGPTR